MGFDQDKDKLKSAFDLSNTPAPKGSEPFDPRRALDALTDDEEAERLLDQDVSRTANGYAQMRRESMSAMRAGVSDNNPNSLENRKKVADEQKRRDVEQQRLAEWNAKMVSVGGVQMTNGQAQDARKRFIEHEDEYAERAVRHGHIRDGEQEDLKRAMRRRHELEDRTGRGTITRQEQGELKDLCGSRMGQAADQVTARVHQEQMLAPDAKASVTKSTHEIFQTAPPVQGQFETAATARVEPKTAPEAPVPVARNVKAMGLDL